MTEVEREQKQLDAWLARVEVKKDLWKKRIKGMKKAPKKSK